MSSASNFVFCHTVCSTNNHHHQHHQMPMQSSTFWRSGDISEFNLHSFSSQKNHQVNANRRCNFSVHVVSFLSFANTCGYPVSLSVAGRGTPRDRCTALGFSPPAGEGGVTGRQFSVRAGEKGVSSYLRYAGGGGAGGVGRGPCLHPTTAER